MILFVKRLIPNMDWSSTGHNGDIMKEVENSLEDYFFNCLELTGLTGD